MTSGALNPGTGTPGYWKNHPDAWPASAITVGGDHLHESQAIAWLGKVSKDKTTTMFARSSPAMLNVMIGNDSSCVAVAITAADAWMAAIRPVGSTSLASSPAWADRRTVSPDVGRLQQRSALRAAPSVDLSSPDHSRKRVIGPLSGSPEGLRYE